MNGRLQTTPEELFQLIGEREFVKFKQGKTIEQLATQIDEMANTITQLRKENEELREKNGRLEQPTHNDSV